MAVPFASAVISAGPASADGCTADNVNFCATLSTNSSAATVGTPILITLRSGLGNDQCFHVADNPAVSELGVGDTPRLTTTPTTGDLTWKVIGPSIPQTVTYYAVYDGSTFSAGNCPDGGPSDPNVLIQQMVQVVPGRGRIAGSPDSGMGGQRLNRPNGRHGKGAQRHAGPAQTRARPAQAFESRVTACVRSKANALCTSKRGTGCSFRGASRGKHTNKRRTT